MPPLRQERESPVLTVRSRRRRDADSDEVFQDGAVDGSIAIVPAGAARRHETRKPSRIEVSVGQPVPGHPERPEGKGLVAHRPDADGPGGAGGRAMVAGKGPLSRDDGLTVGHGNRV